MLLGKGRKESQGIPTSSLADIAFLLLIFFLVTTTINTDKGIELALPRWGDELNVSKKNILNVLINASGEVMLAEEPIQIPLIKQNIEKRLEANDKLIISIKTDPDTKYEVFIQVVDQLKLANATRISIAEPDR